MLLVELVFEAAEGAPALDGPQEPTSGNGGTASRRVAEAVEDLHLRVGNLTAPPKTSSRRLPPLRELLAEQQRAD